MNTLSDENAEALQRYRNHMVLSGLSATTIESRWYSARRFMRRWGRPLEAVKPHHLVEYLSHADWTSNTRHAERASLRGLFAWAASERLTSTDPSSSLPQVPVTTQPRRAASLASIQAALRTAQPRPRLMIELAYTLGLRANEIAVCHPHDIKSDGDGHFRLRVRTRGGKARELGIAASLADSIRGGGDEYLFPGRIAGHISAPYVGKLISQAMPGGETLEQIRQAHREAQSRSISTTGWREVSRFHATAPLRVTQHLEVIDASQLERHFDRIQRDIETDPASAIASCKNLLESLFKLIIRDTGTDQSQRVDLPKLYASVAEQLQLDARMLPESADGANAMRKVLRTLTTTVQSIAELRNNVGDGHGAASRIAVDPSVARLALNATITVAEFIAERWQSRNLQATET